MGRRRLIDQPCPGRFDEDGNPLTYGEVILQGIRIGASLEMSAQAAGVAVRTYHLWREQAEADPPDARYVQFMHDVEIASGEAGLRALASIREAMQGVEYQTTVTTTKPIRIRVEHPDHPGQFIDRIELVTETKVTTGRDVRWQAGAWWLERKQTAEFGRARVWKDLVPPSGRPADEGGEMEGIEAAASAVASAWDRYVARLVADPAAAEPASANGAGESSVL